MACPDLINNNYKACVRRVFLYSSYVQRNINVLFYEVIGDEDAETLSKSTELLVPPFLGLSHGSKEEKEAGKLIWDFYFKDNSYSFEMVSREVFVCINYF